MQKAAEIDLTRRESFSHWTPVTIRFCDQDSMGHVNNCAYAAYVEAARTMLLQPLFDAVAEPNLAFVLARVAIDYRRELHYPGTVEVGARVLRVGNKSFTTGYGVFLGDVCAATAESVNVFFDTERRVAVPPPAALREKLLDAAGRPR